MLHKIGTFLASIRLTLFLLVSLSLISLLAMVSSINKVPWVGELEGTLLGLESNEVFRSWWFLTLISLFFINTFTCTLIQVKRVVRQDPRQRKKLVVFEQRLDPSIDKEEIYKILFRVLKTKGYKVEPLPSEDLLRGSKGRLGLWGSVLFHSGLLGVILGALMSFAMGVSGIFAVTEGFTFSGRAQNYIVYNRGPWLLSSLEPSISIKVNRIQHQYTVKGYPTEFKVDITSFNGEGPGGQKQTITQFEPLQLMNATIYLFKNYGYTPKMLLSLPDLPPMENFFMIPTEIVNGDYRYIKAERQLPKDYILTIEFLPNWKEEGGSFYTIDHRLDNPGLYVLLRRDKATLYEGVVPLGQQVKQEGLVIGFSDLRQWVSFDLDFNPGLPLLYLGSFMMVIGLGFFYLILNRCLSFQFNGTTRVLTMSASFERFPNLQREATEELWHQVLGQLERQGK